MRLGILSDTHDLLERTQHIGERNIAHKFSGMQVSDILKQKKGSIKQAPLPEGAPSWEDFGNMTWEEIEAGAQAKEPGFKVIHKLLTDKRFDK